MAEPTEAPVASAGENFTIPGRVPRTAGQLTPSAVTGPPAAARWVLLAEPPPQVWGGLHSQPAPRAVTSPALSNDKT